MAAFAAEVKLEMRDRTKGRRVPAPHYTTMQKNMTLESALGVLWRTRRAKIVAKVTVCAAELRVGMLRRDPEKTCPQYAILPATRPNLRAKNRRDVVLGRTSKQVKCAVGP